MPRNNEEMAIVTSGDVVAGMLSIPADVLSNLPAIEFNRSWVVLAADSAKVRIPTIADGTTKLADYRVQVSIMRSPVSDDEVAKVDAIDAQRTASQKERDAKAQREREAAIKAAASMATDTVISTVQRLRETVAAGDAAAALAGRLGLR